MTDKDMYRIAFNELAKDYFVPDILPASATMVFLLESPHVQELKFGAPVSGSSGASMTKHLFGERYGSLPIGRVLKDHATDEAVRWLGLMNCCQIPMQRAAYTGKAQSEYSAFFDVLEAVRISNAKNGLPDARGVVQEMIANSLRKKLTLLQERQLVIVPCGRFAQKFFELAGVHSENWSVISSIPHPSYAGWSQQRYQESVRKMIAVFHRMSA